MRIINKETAPHPDFFETLFAYQRKVHCVFKDVLGLYNINHISLTYIDANQRLRSFSSTPSLEFNLFNSQLWHYDKTFQNRWYSLCTSSLWPSLYIPKHYDELYYCKQIKHRYPLGISFAAELTNGYVVYSIASHLECSSTREFFANQHDQLYTIGEYCSNLLLPLFE